jgi:hypothetical protein
MRDSQRRKVYTAERIMERQPGQTDVASPARFQSRVNDIMESQWMSEQFPTAVGSVPVEFGNLRGANANHRRIRVGQNAYAMREWLLIHELSHVIVQRSIGDRHGWTYNGGYHRADGDVVAGHGWQFCDTYLRLVRRFMGQAQHDALKASFKQHKVRYKAPRAKRPVTPELLARLAAGRAKLAAIRAGGAA